VERDGFAPSNKEATFTRRPGIAVMPLRQRRGEREQEYFADAITEDIITALARFRWFWSFIYKDRPIDTKQIARDPVCATITRRRRRFFQDLPVLE
jgi:TolB-like protein